jgi:hypothetical protein
MVFIHRNPTVRALSRTFAGAACLLLAMPAESWSQTHGPAPIPPRVTREINLSGPRFGVTMLSPGNVDALSERGITVRPLVSQFGWQFERRLYRNDDGLTALTEWVPLVSGLDQGLALPSLNWIVGVRTSSGTEFGIGPNLSPTGTGLVFVAGVTLRSGALNVPLNVAVTSSKSGARVTFLTGFNLRR